MDDDEADVDDDGRLEKGHFLGAALKDGRSLLLDDARNRPERDVAEPCRVDVMCQDITDVKRQKQEADEDDFSFGI